MNMNDFDVYCDTIKIPDKDENRKLYDITGTDRLTIRFEPKSNITNY